MTSYQFYIKGSNQLNALAAALVADMRRNKPGVFHPVYIVTQTEGMNNWLRERIAALDGIAANIEFLRPNDIINKIFLAVGGKYHHALSANELSWLLFDALGDHDFQTNYPEVTTYYTEQSKADVAKQMELARKLADIFDQYQVYRQDILKGWENGKLSTTINDERWQKELWLMLKKKAGRQFPSKTATSDFINQQMENPDAVASLKKQLPAIYIFGTVLITEYHRELLLNISRHLNVFLFLPNPAPGDYWYEDQSRRAIFYTQRRGTSHLPQPDTNPLLLDWGKLIQNTFHLLFKSDEAINLYEAVLEETVTNETLLQKIQYHLSANSVPDTGDRFNDALLKDKTITIQSCHSAAREVQVLYNYLVKVTDSHAGKYAARDIVVHVADINLYASYIRSVFENAPYRFKYTIADESYTASDGLSGALYTLLAMDEKDLTAEAVLQLLDYSSIRMHFQIADTDFIRAVVQEAGIRHGINGDFYNDSVYVSWRYGLKRILYGICISGAIPVGANEERFFPIDTVEGSGSNDIIRFCYFAEKLIHLIEQKSGERTVQGWAAYVVEAIEHFVFDDERNDSEEYRLLKKLIDNLSNLNQYFTEKVPYSVFAKQFLPQLQQSAHEYRYSTGGITFCSLIPMRSIPFKIVAMLGLDFDKFPRKENKTGFDLMAVEPRMGDRNVKVNDKHLFLETIMSAGDFLYLSYTGQSIQDNSIRPPSIVVDQLISFIESNAVNPERVKEILVRKQPLHNFSKLYGHAEGLYNYLIDEKKKVDIRAKNPTVPAENLIIKLHDFLSFFKDPIKYYYNKRLHIYYEDESYTLPDTELFELNNLEKWQVKKEWLTESTLTIDDFTLSGIQQGILPLKNAGRMQMQEIAEEMESLKAEFQKHAGPNSRTTMQVSLSIAGHTIEGGVDNLYGERILYPCLSRNDEKHLLTAYIIALISAASARKEVVFIGGNRVRTASMIHQSAAEELLEALLSIYLEGLQKVIVFSASWGINLKDIESLTPAKFNKLAKHNAYFDKETEGMNEEGILAAYQRAAQKILKGFNQVF